MDKVESGAQLFKRAKTDSSQNLPKLFENGPDPGDFIEISGESNSGKTYLMQYYIIKCALPKEFSGNECKVILINTDMKFSIIEFVSLLEIYIKTHMPGEMKNINQIVQNCLANIDIIDCYEHNQYVVTLHNLERLLKYGNNYAIFIDSICPYYRTERISKKKFTYTSYFNEVTGLLKQCVKFQNVLVFFTRDVNYTLHLEQIKLKPVYSIKIVKIGEKHHFRIEIVKSYSEKVSEFIMDVNFQMLTSN